MPLRMVRFPIPMSLSMDGNDLPKSLSSILLVPRNVFRGSRDILVRYAVVKQYTISIWQYVSRTRNLCQHNE